MNSPKAFGELIIHKLLIHGHLICNTRFYLVDTLISGQCAANMYLGGHRPVVVVVSANF